MITTPGFYNISEAEYHADPCLTPSLSSGIARKLVRQSPMHAWHAHPRLNPAGGDDFNSDAADAGTILHKMLLGKGADIVEIDAPDWRTKAAKEAREEARTAGKVPVLAEKLAELHECAKAARRQIEAHPDGCMLFEPGSSEQAMIWREGQSWCRALVDRTPNDPRLPLIDLKTTGMSAAPGEWERRLVSEYAFQAAFYERGAQALDRANRHPMLFIVIETAAPYAVSVMACAPSLRAIADAEVQRGINLWQHCTSTQSWPGYPAQTAYVDAPAWRINQFELEAAE